MERWARVTDVVERHPDIENTAVHNRSEDVSHDDYAVVVLGAGISGLVAASVLLQQGARSILIADEYNHLGGNHIDVAVGPYTFDVGSFIFQDDSPLLAHFPELMELYEPISPSWGRLTPQGFVTRYPISVRDDIIRSGPWPLMRMLGSAAYARCRMTPLRNARDFAQFWIGNYLLHRSGLEKYMTRFYGLPADQIDIDLARKRMLWISEHASLRGLLAKFRHQNSGAPRNRQLVRPRAGFAPLYALARKKLEQKGVKFRLGSPLKAIRREADGYTLQTSGRTIGSRRIVSTIPLTMLESACGLPTTPLQSITLVSLFYSFSGARGFDDPILYNFSHTGAWKRLTMHSDFYGPSEDRQFFSVEVIGNEIGNSAEAADADFKAHMARNGLFKGDLKLEGSYILANAYPIYSAGSAALAQGSIEKLRQFGIDSFGRQGAFNYQPTARVSTIEAEVALARAT